MVGQYAGDEHLEKKEKNKRRFTWWLSYFIYCKKDDEKKNNYLGDIQHTGNKKEKLGGGLMVFVHRERSGNLMPAVPPHDCGWLDILVCLLRRYN